tara:strand:+ start:13650 stop:14138 length:489 start_codon:yes stop_codon:yes gene_type:complete
MLKKLFIVCSLVLAVSACSSGKKKSGATGADAGISSEDLSFDPRGSDSEAIQGLETVNFGYDQATLSAAAKQALQQNAEWLKENSNANMQLEGHCDIRGSIEYNLALGERRARAVKSYLEGLGVSGDRLSVISYGKERLLDEGDSEAAHARNRRVNFVPIAR